MDPLLTKEEKGNRLYGYIETIFNFVLQKPHENNTESIYHPSSNRCNTVSSQSLSYPFSHIHIQLTLLIASNYLLCVRHNAWRFFFLKEKSHSPCSQVAHFPQEEDNCREGLHHCTEYSERFKVKARKEEKLGCLNEFSRATWETDQGQALMVELEFALLINGNRELLKDYKLERNTILK